MTICNTIRQLADLQIGLGCQIHQTTRLALVAVDRTSILVLNGREMPNRQLAH